MRRAVQSEHVLVHFVRTFFYWRDKENNRTSEKSLITTADLPDFQSSIGG